MALTMSVDGFDTSTLGFSVREADARRMYPTREYPTKQIPQKAARILMDTGANYGERVLEVTGQLKGGGEQVLVTDSGDTLVTDSGDSLLARTAEEALYARRDELIGRMSHEEVEISFSDRSGRVFRGRLQEHQHNFLSRALVDHDEVSIAFDLLDPFERSASDITLSGISSGTAQEVALGTAPVDDFTVKIDGPFTDPTITYKDHTGTTQKTVSLTLTKGSSGSVTLDMGAGTITDESSNSQISALDTNQDFPFRLHPRDAEHWNQNWPTLETSDGELTITYQKAWG